MTFYDILWRFMSSEEWQLSQVIPRPPPLRVEDLAVSGTLVVRVARPTSLPIWHRGRSRRKPDCSGSPTRKHFASLDLQKHADFPHRKPTSQDFRRRFFLHFPLISDQAKVFSHRIPKKKLFRIASDLGVCDSNRIAHRGCIAQFGPLSLEPKNSSLCSFPCLNSTLLTFSLLQSAPADLPQ